MPHPHSSIRTSRNGTSLAALVCAVLLSGLLAAASIPSTAQTVQPLAGVAQAGRMSLIDPRALSLLRQTKAAERSLVLGGEQVTVLYSERGRPPEQSEQTIYFDASRGYRCEYHQPDRIAGQVIVSRADGFWHFMPRRHLLVVGEPRSRRIGAQIGPALKALRYGFAQASLIGTDTIAGRFADIVVISAIASATPPARAVPTAKLWIDPTSGAQLRTELYDAQGSLRSVSYFTQINYAPSFPPDTFAPPAVPPGTTTVAQQPPTKLGTIPTDAEAGFHVLAPATLPAGYTFESASVFHYGARRGQGVTLRYRSTLGALSLFERALNIAGGQTSPSAASPRAGTVVVRRDGMELIAIGSLGNDELLSVLNSMR